MLLEICQTFSYQIRKVNNQGTHLRHIRGIWHVPCNIRIRWSMLRNKSTVFPRCHSPSSIQPSLSLHCLGLLVHAEELCRFAFDVAETENKVPFELFLQRIPSTAHFRCFMSSGNRGGGKLVAPRIHSLTGRWSKIYVYPLPLTAAWQIFEPTKSFDERSSRAQYEYCIVWTMVTWWLLKWYSLFTGLHNLNWLFKRLRKEFLHQAFHAST